MSKPQKPPTLHDLTARGDEEMLERLQTELGAWSPDTPHIRRGWTIERQVIHIPRVPKTGDGITGNFSNIVWINTPSTPKTDDAYTDKKRRAIAKFLEPTDEAEQGVDV